jgi:hypothetical protein
MSMPLSHPIIARFWAVAIGAFLMPLLVAHASVFSLSGDSWNGWVPTDGLPWEKAYETEMVVDGQRLMLHLYSARYTEPVIEQLKRRFAAAGATMKYTATADGMTGFGRKGALEVRVLVSSSETEPRHLIFLTYRNPNARRPIKDPVALYPHAKKVSSVANLGTGTVYLSLRTHDTPMQVHEFYERTMAAEGWVRMTPTMAERGGTTGMAVFQRKKKVCFIQVRQGRGISANISILVKKGIR